MLSGRRPVLGVAAIGLAVLGLSACDPGPSPWTSEMVSVNVDGTGGGDAGPQFVGPHTPIMSPDGTKVLFESPASNLVPTDTNGASDVFVRDLVTGTTSLVSVNAAGTDSGNAVSQYALLSPDGTKVAFWSFASNLGHRDTNNRWDIYLRDLHTGTTILVSANASGSNSGNDTAYSDFAFSPDANSVAFSAGASDLVAGDGNGTLDVFIRDLVAGATTLGSTNALGGFPNDGSLMGEYSPDGTKFTFNSSATDLGPDDQNGVQDAYVHDLVTGENILVNTNAAGTGAGDGYSAASWFVGDTKVVFESFASDLGHLDTNQTLDIYVRDLATGTTSLITHNVDDTDAAAHVDTFPSMQSISPDGRQVAFWDTASDVVAADTNGKGDAFLADLETGVTTLVSLNAGGTDTAAGNSVPGVFSPDGTKLTLVSDAPDLGPRDDNQQVDVYVRDLTTGGVLLVSANAAGTNSGNLRSFGGRFSPDGRQIVFASQANDLGPPDDSFVADIYLATLQGADLAVDAQATPEPVASGETLTYQLDLNNAGPDMALDAKAGLLLPAGVVFVDATSSQGTCQGPAEPDPRLVVCSIGDLAAGDSAQVTITASVTAPAGATLSALSGVFGSGVDPWTANNLESVESTVTA